MGHTSLILNDILSLNEHLNVDVCVFFEKYCYTLQKEIYTEDGELDVKIREICLNKIKGGCVFLKGKLCSIQKNKPLICKAYPFIESYEHLVSYQSLMDYCKGFGHGKLYSPAEIDKLILKYNKNYYTGIEKFIKVQFDFKKLFGCEPSNIKVVKLFKSECTIK